MKYKLLKEAILQEMIEDDDDDMEPSHGDGLLNAGDSMYSVSFYGDSMDPHPIVIRVEAEDESTALEMAVAKLEKEYDGACLTNPYDEDNEDGDMPDDCKMEVDGTMYGASQPWCVNPQLIHIKEMGPIGESYEAGFESSDPLPDGTSKETCSFRDFKRFAKSLGYKITSSVTDFGGFGYGSARFYKVFQGDRKIIPLDPRKKDEYVKGWWDKAMSMDREFQEFVLSHKIMDDDGRKCIPNPS